MIDHMHICTFLNHQLGQLDFIFLKCSNQRTTSTCRFNQLQVCPLIN